MPCGKVGHPVRFFLKHRGLEVMVDGVFVGSVLFAARFGPRCKAGAVQTDSISAARIWTDPDGSKLVDLSTKQRGKLFHLVSKFVTRLFRVLVTQVIIPSHWEPVFLYLKLISKSGLY